MKRFTTRLTIVLGFLLSVVGLRGPGYAARRPNLPADAQVRFVFDLVQVTQAQADSIVANGGIVDLSTYLYFSPAWETAGYFTYVSASDIYTSTLSMVGITESFALVDIGNGHPTTYPYDIHKNTDVARIAPMSTSKCSGALATTVAQQEANQGAMAGLGFNNTCPTYAYGFSPVSSASLTGMNFVTMEKYVQKISGGDYNGWIRVRLSSVRFIYKDAKSFYVSFYSGPSADGTKSSNGTTNCNLNVGSDNVVWHNWDGSNSAAHGCSGKFDWTQGAGLDVDQIMVGSNCYQEGIVGFVYGGLEIIGSTGIQGELAAKKACPGDDAYVKFIVKNFHSGKTESDYSYQYQVYKNGSVVATRTLSLTTSANPTASQIKKLATTGTGNPDTLQFRVASTYLTGEPDSVVLTLTPSTFSGTPSRFKATLTYADDLSGFKTAFSVGGDMDIIAPVVGAYNTSPYDSMGKIEKGTTVIAKPFCDYSSSTAADLSITNFNPWKPCGLNPAGGFVLSGWVIKTPVSVYRGASPTSINIFVAGPNADGDKTRVTAEFALNEEGYYAVEVTSNEGCKFMSDPIKVGFAPETPPAPELIYNTDCGYIVDVTATVPNSVSGTPNDWKWIVATYSTADEENPEASDVRYEMGKNVSFHASDVIPSYAATPGAGSNSKNDNLLYQTSYSGSTAKYRIIGEGTGGWPIAEDPSPFCYDGNTYGSFSYWPANSSGVSGLNTVGMGAELCDVMYFAQYRIGDMWSEWGSVGGLNCEDGLMFYSDISDQSISAGVSLTTCVVETVTTEFSMAYPSYSSVTSRDVDTIVDANAKVRVKFFLYPFEVLGSDVFDEGTLLGMWLTVYWQVRTPGGSWSTWAVGGANALDYEGRSAEIQIYMHTSDEEEYRHMYYILSPEYTVTKTVEFRALIVTEEGCNIISDVIETNCINQFDEDCGMGYFSPVARATVKGKSGEVKHRKHTDDNSETFTTSALELCYDETTDIKLENFDVAAGTTLQWQYSFTGSATNESEWFNTGTAQTAPVSAFAMNDVDVTSLITGSDWYNGEDIYFRVKVTPPPGGGDPENTDAVKVTVYDAKPLSIDYTGVDATVGKVPFGAGYCYYEDVKIFAKDGAAAITGMGTGYQKILFQANKAGTPNAPEFADPYVFQPSGGTDIDKTYAGSSTELQNGGSAFRVISVNHGCYAWSDTIKVKANPQVKFTSIDPGPDNELESCGDTTIVITVTADNATGIYWFREEYIDGDNIYEAYDATASLTRTLNLPMFGNKPSEQTIYVDSVYGLFTDGTDSRVCWDVTTDLDYTQYAYVNIIICESAAPTPNKTAICAQSEDITLNWSENHGGTGNFTLKDSVSGGTTWATVPASAIKSATAGTPSSIVIDKNFFTANSGTPNTAKTYSFKIETGGSVSKVSAAVTVNPQPNNNGYLTAITPTMKVDGAGTTTAWGTPICAGSSTRVDIESGWTVPNDGFTYSFEWQDANTGATKDGPTVKAQGTQWSYTINPASHADSGEYMLIVEAKFGSTGCVDRDTLQPFVLRIDSIPSAPVITNLRDTTLCEGEQLELKPVLKNTANKYFEASFASWTKPNAGSTLQTSNTPGLPGAPEELKSNKVVKTTDHGAYIYKVKAANINNHACVSTEATQTVNVTVNTTPDINTTDLAAKLTLNGTAAAWGDRVCANQEIKIETANAVPNDGNTYTFELWKTGEASARKTENTAAGNKFTYTKSSAALSDSGTYFLAIKAKAGNCEDRDTLKNLVIIVDSVPSAPVITGLPTDTTVCEGNALSFMPVLKNTDNKYFESAYDSWTFAGTSSFSVTNAPNALPGTAKKAESSNPVLSEDGQVLTYKVKAANINNHACVSTEAQKQVTVHIKQQPDLGDAKINNLANGSTVEECLNNKVELNATTTNTPSGGNSGFIWYKGTTKLGETSSKLTLPAGATDREATYKVKAWWTVGSCTDTATTSIVFQEKEMPVKPTVEHAAAVGVCPGDKVNIEANVEYNLTGSETEPTYQYLWYEDPLTGGALSFKKNTSTASIKEQLVIAGTSYSGPATDYDLKLSASGKDYAYVLRVVAEINGCFDTSTFTGKIDTVHAWKTPDDPNASFTPNPIVICSGVDTLLIPHYAKDTTTDGKRTFTYQWSNPHDPSAGDNPADLKVRNYRPTAISLTNNGTGPETRTFTLKTTVTENGCTAEFSNNVDVKINPVPAFIKKDINEIFACEGEDVVLNPSVQISTGGTVYYQWLKDGNVVKDFAAGSNYTIKNATQDSIKDHVYKVVLRANSGDCYTYDTLEYKKDTIHVYPHPPKPGITLSPDTSICSNQHTIIKATLTEPDPKPAGWTYDFRWYAAANPAIDSVVKLDATGEPPVGPNKYNTGWNSTGSCATALTLDVAPNGANSLPGFDGSTTIHVGDGSIKWYFFVKITSSITYAGNKTCRADTAAPTAIVINFYPCSDDEMEGLGTCPEAATVPSLSLKVGQPWPKNDADIKWYTKIESADATADAPAHDWAEISNGSEYTISTVTNNSATPATKTVTVTPSAMPKTTTYFKAHVPHATGDSDVIVKYEIYEAPNLAKVTIAHKPKNLLLAEQTEFCAGDTMIIGGGRLNTALTDPDNYVITGGGFSTILVSGTQNIPIPAEYNLPAVYGLNPWGGKLGLPATQKDAVGRLIYTLNVETNDAHKCKLTKADTTDEITIHSLPMFDITFDPTALSVCEGVDTLLTPKATQKANQGGTVADGGFAYKWRNETLPAGFFSTDKQIRVTAAKGDTTYKVFVTSTDNHGCSHIDSGSIQVNHIAKPVVDAKLTISPNEVCRQQNAKITFTASDGNSANSGGTYHYAWTVPAGVADPGDVNTFDIAAGAALMRDSGEYKVTISYAASNNCGADDSAATAVLKVHELPSKPEVEKGSEKNICQGGSGKLPATVKNRKENEDAGNSYTFQWYKYNIGDGSSAKATATGNNTDTLRLGSGDIPAIGASDYYYARVVIKNGSGCTDTSVIPAVADMYKVTTVDCADPTLTSPVICIADTGSPAAVITLSCNPDYKILGWYMSADSNIAVTPWVAADGVQDPASVSGENNYSYKVANKVLAKMRASGNGIFADFPYYFMVKIEKPDASQIEVGTKFMIKRQPDITALAVTVENGTDDGDAKKFCAAEDVNLKVALTSATGQTSDNYDYAWAADFQNQRSFAGTINKPADKTGADITSTTAGGENLPVVSTAANTDAEGYWVLTVTATTNGNCSDSKIDSTPLVKIYPIPGTKPTAGNVEVCEGLTAEFKVKDNIPAANADTTVQEIVWHKQGGAALAAVIGRSDSLALNNVAKADAGTYFAVITSKSTRGGCINKDSATITLTVNEKPKLTADWYLSDSANCPRNEITFEVKNASATTSGGTIVYDWFDKDNNSFTPSASDTKHVIASAAASDDKAKYSVWVSYTDGKGCIADTLKFDTVIAVFAAPVAATVATQPQNVVICRNSDAIVTVETSGDPAPAGSKYIYNWYETTTAPTTAPYSGGTLVRTKQKENGSPDPSNSVRKDTLWFGSLGESPRPTGSTAPAKRYYYVEIVTLTENGCTDTVQSMADTVQLTTCSKPKLDTVRVCPGEDPGTFKLTYYYPNATSVDWYYNDGDGWKAATGTQNPTTLNVAADGNTAGETVKFTPAQSCLPTEGKSYRFAAVIDAGMGTFATDTSVYQVYPNPVELGIDNIAVVEKNSGNAQESYCVGTNVIITPTFSWTPTGSGESDLEYGFEYTHVSDENGDAVRDTSARKTAWSWKAGVGDMTLDPYTVKAGDTGEFVLKVKTRSAAHHCEDSTPAVKVFSIKVDQKPDIKSFADNDGAGDQKAEFCADKETVNYDELKLKAEINVGAIAKWQRLVSVSSSQPAANAAGWATFAAAGTNTSYQLKEADLVFPGKGHDTTNHFRIVVASGVCDTVYAYYKVTLIGLPTLDTVIITPDVLEGCDAITLTANPKDAAGNTPEGTPTYKWQTYETGKTPQWVESAGTAQTIITGKPDTAFYRCIVGYTRSAGSQNCKLSDTSVLRQVKIYEATELGTLACDTAKPICHISPVNPQFVYTPNKGHVKHWVVSDDKGNSDTLYDAASRVDTLLFDLNSDKVQTLLKKTASERYRKITVKAVVQNGDCNVLTATATLDIYDTVPKIKAVLADGVSSPTCSLAASAEFAYTGAVLKSHEKSVFEYAGVDLATATASQLCYSGKATVNLGDGFYPKYNYDTTYYVHVRDSNLYCPAKPWSEVVELKVIRQPKPVTVSASTPVCFGDNDTAAATRPASTPLVWKYVKEGNTDTLQVSQDDILLVGNVEKYGFTPAAVGKYLVIAYDTACGKEGTRGTKLVEVIESPHVGSLTVNNGGKFCNSENVGAEATGITKNAKTVWQLTIDTAATALYDTKNLTADADGKASYTHASLSVPGNKKQDTVYFLRYFAEGANGCDGDTTAWQPVQIFRKPACDNFSALTPVVVCEGDSVIVKMQANAYGYDYELYADGTLIKSGAMGDTNARQDTVRPVVSGSALSATVTYSVKFKANPGLASCNESTESCQVAVTVHKAPKAGDLGFVNVALLNDTTITAGQPAVMKFDGTEGTDYWGTTYEYYKYTSTTELTEPASDAVFTGPNGFTPAGTGYTVTNGDMPTTFFFVKVTTNSVCPADYSDTVRVKVESATEPFLSPVKPNICVTETPGIRIFVPEKLGFDWTEIAWLRKAPGETEYTRVTLSDGIWDYKDATDNDTIAWDLNASVPGTYSYRMLYKSTPDTTLPVSIYVDSLSVAGTLSIDKETVCLDGDRPEIKLTGYKGKIEQLWFKKDTTGDGWDNYATRTAGATYKVETSSLADSGFYKAVVKTQYCPADTSNPVLARIIPKPEAGKLKGDTVCFNTAGAQVAYSGGTGYTKLVWQTSAQESGPYTDIANDDATSYTAGALTDHLWLRVYVSEAEGVCEADTSGAVSVDIYDSIAVTQKPTAQTKRKGEGATAEFNAKVETAGLTYATDGLARIENAPKNHTWQMSSGDGNWSNLATNSDFTCADDKLTVVNVDDNCGNWFRLKAESTECAYTVYSDSAQLNCWDVSDPGTTESVTVGTCFFNGASARYEVVGAKGDGALSYKWWVQDNGGDWHSLNDPAYDALGYTFDDSAVIFPNVTTLMEAPYNLKAVKGCGHDAHSSTCEPGTAVDIEICAYDQPSYTIDSLLVCVGSADQKITVEESDHAPDDYGTNYKYYYKLSSQTEYTALVNGTNTISEPAPGSGSFTVTVDSFGPATGGKTYAQFNTLPAWAHNMLLKVEVYSKYAAGLDTTLFALVRVDQPVKFTKNQGDTVCTGGDMEIFSEFKRQTEDVESALTGNWYFVNAGKTRENNGGASIADNASPADKINYKATKTETGVTHSSADSVWILEVQTEICTTPVADTMIVHVYDQPQLVSVTTPAEICAGSAEITLTATANLGDHTGAYEHGWEKKVGGTWVKLQNTPDKDGGDSVKIESNGAGLSDGKLTLKYASAYDAGLYRYRMQISDPCPRDTSIEVPVKVKVPPMAVLNPGPAVSVTVKTGNTAPVTADDVAVADMATPAYDPAYVTANSVTGYTWTFYKPNGSGYTEMTCSAVGALVSGCDSKTITLQPQDDSYTGTYFKVKVSGECGDYTTLADTLKINNTFAIGIGLKDTVVCTADTALFYVYTNDSAHTFTWDYSTDGTTYTDIYKYPDNGVTLPAQTAVSGQAGAFWVVDVDNTTHQYILKVKNPTPEMDGWKVGINICDNADCDNSEATLHVNRAVKFTDYVQVLNASNGTHVFEPNTDGNEPENTTFSYDETYIEGLTTHHTNKIEKGWDVKRLKDNPAQWNTEAPDASTYTFTSTDVSGSPLHDSGSYAVRLHMGNACGADTAYDTVHVIKLFHIQVPTGAFWFSPSHPYPWYEGDTNVLVHDYSKNYEGALDDTTALEICDSNQIFLVAHNEGDPVNEMYWEKASTRDADGNLIFKRIETGKTPYFEVGDTLKVDPAVLAMEGDMFRRAFVMPGNIDTFYTNVFKLRKVNLRPDIDNLVLRIVDVNNGPDLTPTAGSMGYGEAKENNNVRMYVADTANKGNKEVRYNDEYGITEFWFMQYHTATGKVDTLQKGTNPEYTGIAPAKVNLHDSTVYFVKLYNDCGYRPLEKQVLRVYDTLVVYWRPDTTVYSEKWTPEDVDAWRPHVKPGQLVVVSAPGDEPDRKQYNLQYEAHLFICDQGYENSEDAQAHMVMDTATQGFMNRFFGVDDYGLLKDATSSYYIYRDPLARIEEDDEWHIALPAGQDYKAITVNEKTGELEINVTMRLEGVQIIGVGVNNHYRDSTKILTLHILPSLAPGSLQLTPSDEKYCQEAEDVHVDLSSTLYTGDANDPSGLYYLYNVDSIFKHYDMDWYISRDNKETWSHIDTMKQGARRLNLGDLKYPEDSVIDVMVTATANCGVDTARAHLEIVPKKDPMVKAIVPEFVCLGNDIAITEWDSMAGNKPEFDWQLLLPDTSSVMASANDNRNFNIPGAAFTKPGVYPVVVNLTVHGGWCYNDTVAVDTTGVNVLPNLSDGDMKIKPEDTVFCQEADVIFTLYSPDGAPLNLFNLQWQEKVAGQWADAPSDKVSADKLIFDAGHITAVGKDTTVSVRVIGWGDCGRDTAYAVAKVEPPVEPKVVIEDKEYCEGDNFIFTAVFAPETEGLEVVYEWYVDGAKQADSTNVFNASGAVKATGEYVIDVIARPAAGLVCFVPDTAADKAKLTVRNVPVIDTAWAHETVLKSGGYTPVEAVAENGYDGTDTDLTYLWTGATFENAASDSTLAGPFNKTGVDTLHITVTNKYNCRAVDSVIIRVESDFKIDSMFGDVITPPALPIPARGTTANGKDLPGYPVNPNDPYDWRGGTPFYHPEFGGTFKWRTDTTAVLYICPHNTALLQPQIKGGEWPITYKWTRTNGNAAMVWPADDPDYRARLDWDVVYPARTGKVYDTARKDSVEVVLDSVYGIFFPDRSTTELKVDVRDATGAGSEITIHVIYLDPELFYLEVQPKLSYRTFYEGQGLNFQAKPQRDWDITWITLQNDQSDRIIVDTFTSKQTAMQKSFQAQTKNKNYSRDADQTSIWITTIDRYGCRIWDSTSVRILPPPNVLLFNHPKEGVIFPEFYVEITNMWGTKVKAFEDRNANGNSKGWDGRSPSGTPVVAGTYYYRVKIPTLITEKDKSGYMILTGAVTVINTDEKNYRK